MKTTWFIWLFVIVIDTKIRSCSLSLALSLLHLQYIHQHHISVLKSVSSKYKTETKDYDFLDGFNVGLLR